MKYYLMIFLFFTFPFCSATPFWDIVQWQYTPTPTGTPWWVWLLVVMIPLLLIGVIALTCCVTVKLLKGRREAYIIRDVSKILNIIQAI